jgi:hypothetical protein
MVSLSRKGTFQLTRSYSLCAVLVLMLFLAEVAQGGESSRNPRQMVNTGEIVEKMVRMNLQRADALQAYQSTRIYKLQYHGFPGSRSAEMVVLMKYVAPGAKEFIIQSSTGSRLVVEKVFKKLLESEKEASETQNQALTALTPANYVFTLLEYQEGSGSERPTYLLAVEPKNPSKFLYRGKIWIDAEDFAVVRLEVQPAKNPSFWTKNTTIEHRYMKVNDFWFPYSNHSVSEVRLGGRADLEIEYKDYQITTAHPLPTSSLAHAAK